MIPEDDLLSMDARLAPLWPSLKGAHIFMTGGTGVIGRWMLEAFVRSGSDAKITILSRNPAAFARKVPHIAPRCDFVLGDVLTFTAPKQRFTHVIHGATDASADLNARDPQRMFDTIVSGTRRVLDLTLDSDANKLLFMSSGAVYGPQPQGVIRVTEDWHGGPNPRDPLSAYGEGKRAAETLCAIYQKQFGLSVTTARIFALLGPLLPLDTHFAAGNFIRDAMAGQTIQVQGSGQAVRSYLYLSDVAVWLWSMLLRAEPGATYNVGSEEAVSIAELAQRTANLLGGAGVEILGKPDQGWNPGRYVPSNAAIRRDLGLTPTVPLNEAIRRTALANGWTR